MVQVPMSLGARRHVPSSKGPDIGGGHMLKFEPLALETNTMLAQVVLAPQPQLLPLPSCDGSLICCDVSKLSRPYNAASLPAPTRLRRNLEELYTNNNISAVRAQELFNDAAAAGDTHCRPLQGRLGGSNVARRLRRKLMK